MNLNHDLIPNERFLSLAQSLGNVPMRPFQFSSLEHLDQRVVAALSRMRDVEGLSPRTLQQRHDTYRVFREFLKHRKHADRLLSGDLSQQVSVLEDFIADMRARPLARATINSYWRAMRAIFERVRRDDGMVNPFAFVRTPRPGHARLRCLTPEAAERILTFVQNEGTVAPAVRVRNAAIVATMLLAGVRKSELLHLRVSHVDLDSRTVAIVNGKGEDGGKSRTVPMTRQLHRFLSAYAQVRGLTKTGVPEFFLATHQDKALSATTLRRIFYRASLKTGIHVSPHMLRHTFCTLLSRFGVSDRLAREAMGHADSRTLQRYQHVYEGELAETMERLALNVDVPR